jgi:hypothetical protein
VRKVKPGVVTELLRGNNATNVMRADERRKASHIADLEKKAGQHLKEGIAHNKNLEEPLTEPKEALTDNLEVLGNAVGTSLAYLKRKFEARDARAITDKFTYPSIGPWLPWRVLGSTGPVQHSTAFFFGYHGTTKGTMVVPVGTMEM